MNFSHVSYSYCEICGSNDHLAENCFIFDESYKDPARCDDYLNNNYRNNMPYSYYDNCGTVDHLSPDYRYFYEGSINEGFGYINNSNQQYSSYNVGWSNYPNYSYNNDVYTPPHYTSSQNHNFQNYPPPNQYSRLENKLQKFMDETNEALQALLDSKKAQVSRLNDILMANNRWEEESPEPIYPSLESETHNERADEIIENYETPESNTLPVHLIANDKGVPMGLYSEIDFEDEESREDECSYDKSLPMEEDIQEKEIKTPIILEKPFKPLLGGRRKIFMFDFSNTCNYPFLASDHCCRECSVAHSNGIQATTKNQSDAHLEAVIRTIEESFTSSSRTLNRRHYRKKKKKPAYLGRQWRHRPRYRSLGGLYPPPRPP